MSSAQFDAQGRFPKQFCITPEEGDSPVEGWVKHEVFGRFLWRSPELPITIIRDSKCSLIGVLLGWTSLSDCRTNQADVVCQDGEEFRELRERCCGRYIILYMDDGRPVCETDAGGLLSLVYSSDRKILAATTALLEELMSFELDDELRELIPTEKQQGWYPFGLTRVLGVRRLLPNHCLDLTCFQPKRGGEVVSPLLTRQEAVEAIANEVEANAIAFAAGQRVFAHITAGRDSRMMLACMRPLCSLLELETICDDGADSLLDAAVGKRLAAIAGVRHERLDLVPQNKMETDAWLKRIGYAVNDTVTYLGATAEKYAERKPTLAGVCGEVGRAYYWKEADLSSKGAISPEDIVRRLGFPVVPRLISEATAWVEDLGSHVASVTDVLDHMYIEQRLGCWAGPSVYGHDTLMPTLSPFNSKRIYRLMISLPRQYRFEQKLADEIIAYKWPELRHMGYNRAPGLLRVRFWRKEISRLLPGSLKKRLRELLGGD